MFADMNARFEVIEKTFNQHMKDPTCVHNAMSILCSAAFRECQEIEEGWWLPSLLCRAECDRRLSIWVCY
jgi:hypothetical protein